MKRTVITISCAAVAFGGLLETASAGPSANAPASCVGVITSTEASQLAPGSVGQEVSGLAHGVPRVGHTLVSPLAHSHSGSCG